LLESVGRAIFQKNLMARGRKAFASSSHRSVAETLSLTQQLVLALQRHRFVAGIGIAGVVCIVLAIAVASAYWGERQRRGLMELQGGILALQTGDTDRATSQLELAEQHLKANGAGYLAQLARLNLGYVAEQQGDLARARQYYETSADLEGPVKPEALLSTARVLALQKDDGAAEVYYKKFLAQYRDSPVAEIVRQKVRDR